MNPIIQRKHSRCLSSAALTRLPVSTAQKRAELSRFRISGSMPDFA